MDLVTNLSKKMMYGSNWGWNNGWPMAGGNGWGGLLFVLVVWDLIWKGVALWKSAKHDQKYWFIALLLINSFGILPIVYIQFFQKKGKKK